LTKTSFRFIIRQYMEYCIIKNTFIYKFKPGETIIYKSLDEIRFLSEMFLCKEKVFNGMIFEKHDESTWYINNYADMKVLVYTFNRKCKNIVDRLQGEIND
jgi:hypothetical protein